MNKSLVTTFATLTFLLASLAPSGARADEHPIQLSLLPSIQIFDRGTDIKGVRLMIAGENANVAGLDIGIVGITTGSFQGLQWGVVGIVGGESMGWQNNWIVNQNKGIFRGLQTAAVNVGADSRGVQFGFVNYNVAASGLQISFVNYAETLDGLQIGILNIAKNAGGHPVLPLVNWVF